MRQSAPMPPLLLPRHLDKARQLLAIGLVLVGGSQLSGCMSLHLEAGPHDVKVTRHLGLLHVELRSPERAVVGQLSGLGLALTPLGLVLGHARQRFAALGPQCRAVLWIDDASALDEAARRHVQQLAGVCLVEAHAPDPR